MPRPPRPWFRMWSELMHSQKIHAMPDKLVKPWLFLLCMASEHDPRGTLPPVQKIAFALRIKEERAKSILADLMNLRLVAFDGGHYVMHDWLAWQPDSDANLSPGRSGRHAIGTPKERDRNAEGTPSARLDREGEGEEEKKREKERESAETRAPFEFNLEPPFPDDPDEKTGLVAEYLKHYRVRTGSDYPGVGVVADLKELERDFGYDACAQAMNDTGWEKGPKWIRPRLEERRARGARGEFVTATPSKKSLRYDDS